MWEKKTKSHYISPSVFHLPLLYYLRGNGSVYFSKKCHKHSHKTNTQEPLGSFYSLVIYEGVFIDGLDDRLECDLGGQSVAVLHHRLSIRTVPAVHCRGGGKV